MMDQENEKFNKNFYQVLEQSIGKLPQETRSKLYRSCAEHCAGQYVLAEQQRLFEECDKDLDKLYEKYGRSEYLFAEIIERGHVYEIGYPTSKCFCPMVASGMATSAVHCECSKQSILYVLETLLPDKKITAEMLHSVMTGAKECRFRVVIE